jgi:hypothetical protein
MRTKTLFLVVAIAAGLGLGPSVPVASAQDQPGTRRLEGRRYEALRALARRLDDTARAALDGVDARHGTPSEASFRSSVRSFARRARELRAMIDDHPPSPMEVPARVRDLAALAHRVDDRIRSARGLAGTYDDWEGILEVLERMRLLLTGRDREASAQAVAALSGSSLRECPGACAAKTT